MTDIVVTATPDIVVTGNNAAGAPVDNLPGGSGAGVVQAQVSAAIAAFNSKQHFQIEPDVQNADITVIGQKVVDLMLQSFVPSVIGNAGPFQVTHVGAISRNEFANILLHLKFVVTNQNFGTGRAGENKPSPITQDIVVRINVDKLRGYDLLAKRPRLLDFPRSSPRSPCRTSL